MGREYQHILGIKKSDKKIVKIYIELIYLYRTYKIYIYIYIYIYICIYIYITKRIEIFWFKDFRNTLGHIVLNIFKYIFWYIYTQNQKRTIHRDFHTLKLYTLKALLSKKWLYFFFLIL